jgi:hypothetical protein
MTTLTVGPGQQFATIHEAVDAAAAGDTIDVQGGAGITYTNDFVYIGKSLTLQAVGGEVQMVATVQPPNGKAMIVEGVPGASIAINGFDISGVSVGDGNGAAIRHEGGALSLTDDYFHNNQEGLLGNGDDPNGSITVEHSEFAFNGDGSGFTHNFYAGAIASVSINNSYFHDADVGHEIKSRAASTTVTNSRVLDNNSSASYSIDTPNGGNVNISHNVIEQGPNSENFYIIAYGEEGSRGGSASIDSNVIVNDRDGGRAVLAGGPVSFTNNQDWNLPDLGGVSSASGNVDLASRPSLDTSSLSFISQPSDSGGTGGATGGGTTAGDIPGTAGGGAGGTVSPPEPPPVAPPEPPPVSPPESPGLTLDQYHNMVLTDFGNYWLAHQEVVFDANAMIAFATELTSTTVLASPVPGDLWS